MVDTRVQSNGNINVYLVPASGVADYRSPTAAEIAAGINLSEAIAWDGFELTASDSNDVDDRGLMDAGNAVTRGFQQFAASIPFFYPKDLNDPTDPATIAFEALARQTRQTWYLITKVLQGTTGTPTPAVAGEWVSVYKFMSDYTSDDTEGEDSYKFTIGFLPQGQVKVYTQVKTALPVVVAPATLAVDVDEAAIATATLGGKSITQGATWTSSDPSVARVTPNGVVVGVSAGTATISASHPAATAAGTVTVTVS